MIFQDFRVFWACDEAGYIVAKQGCQLIVRWKVEMKSEM